MNNASKKFPNGYTRHLNGYTLLELITVIVLLGILFSWAMFPVSDKTLIVEATRQDVARAIRYTQSLSMASQGRYRINLGQNSSSYTITSSDGLSDVSSHFSPISPIPLAEGVTLSHTSALPNNYIVFDGLGIPYTDNANTVLNSTAVISLSESNSQALSLLVYPQTGAVYP